MDGPERYLRGDTLLNIGRRLIARSAYITLFAIPLLLAACLDEDRSPSGSGASGVLATAVRSADETLSILLMARDVEVGQTRVPIVVLLSDENQTRLDDRLSELSFNYRHIDEESFNPLPTVTWRSWPVRGGAYIGVPDFDRPGIWEFQVSFQDGGGTRVGSSFLQVEQDSSAPSVGDEAPLTVTKTANTVDEVRQISSALDPDPRFYAISLDKALKNGRPTAVLFSTPAFCVTQTCGPQLETLGKLMDVLGGDMDFIHVEIFDNIREMLDTGDSSIGRIAQPVEDWGLITEPWTFFVDANGVVAARFEQFTTFEELSEAASSLLPAN